MEFETEINQQIVPPPNNIEEPQEINKPDELENPQTGVEEESKPQEKNNPNDFEVKIGDVIELDGVKYIIDENKNLIDENNKIFKEAKDVKDFLKSFEENNDVDADTFSLDSIKNLIDIKIVDNSDKEIEFENSKDGIKAYLNAVIDTVSKDTVETEFKKLYNKYPVLENVINHLIINNGSLDGFSTNSSENFDIELDENNEEQLIAIIKRAWTEKNNKGNVDHYIKYLKDSNQLYTIADDELKALKETYKSRNSILAEQAKAAREAEQKAAEEYWNNVKNSIDSGVIGDYNIPERIVINKNGKKLVHSREDFFKYLYEVDNQGLSRYEKELSQRDNKKQLNDELLSAYLTFVGGDYSSLLDMKQKEQEVRVLRLKSKQAKTSNSNKPTNKSEKEDKAITFEI